MSRKGEPGGQVSTTALSTVAVQAGDTQIVVAVLKCGELVELRLTEAHPDLLEIGSNQDESKKLLEEHDQLLTKLKRNERGVQALLEEADNTSEKEGKEDVYEAMALSLSEAWKTLVSHLEKRRSLLQLACHFYDYALEFAIKIDEADQLQSGGEGLNITECLTVLKQKYISMKRGLLQKSLLALNKSYELLEFLKNFEREKVLQYGGRSCAARDSYRKVEGLMELLQDRRREIDKYMAQQMCDLELADRITDCERRVQEITQWFKENSELLENNQLGSSLSESEKLLQQHKEFEQKAKDWGVLVERLQQQLPEFSSFSDDTKLEVLSEKSKTLITTQERFMDLMICRQEQLQESNTFFSSANRTFETLATIENTIKSLSTQALQLPELAGRHEELHRIIKDAAANPLQQGKIILQKLNSQSVQAVGVQRMMGYISGQVARLSQQRQAYREKRQHLLTTFADLEKKISGWLKSSNNFLSSSTELGLCLSEAEEMLRKHLDLSANTQSIVTESDAAKELIEELRKLESSDAVELDNKTFALKDQLKTFQQKLSARMEIIRSFVSFLLSAKEVEDLFTALMDYYKNKPETEDENEEPSVCMKEVMDETWQSFLQTFLSMQDLGNNFINSSNMVSETLNLNVKTAVSVVERNMECLNKKKVELSDLWTTWQLHYSQMKSVKKQWKKFKDHLKKVVHELKSLEGTLAPTTKVDLGCDLQIVSKLQDTFSSMKPQFLQLNAEVEFLVKISELLVLKGIPSKEKNDRLSELLLVHQRVGERIREYETVLSMTLKFHQVYQEVDSLLKAKPVKGSSDLAQAKIQEQQNHIRQLYKLAISLAADITKSVQQKQMLVFSVREKMEHLRHSSASWFAQAKLYEEDLMSNAHHCVFKEEINELKESFKDLKKKFNNMKFNYIKKNEKLRNLKAVKNQIQQIEIYIDKLQVLKKKLQAFTLKVSSSSEKHLLNSSPRELEDAINELQRQVSDFDRTVEDYKQNLDLSMKLQQAMEEYEFWCDEASSTIVRVGKYSSECKTKEAISSLYKQFEKFVWPTIPQQEERISQITEIAVQLHGAEEGKKFLEKTVNKHSEIVESIKELSSGLLDLEAKLKAESWKAQYAEENKSFDTVETPESKETGHTPEITGVDGKKDDLVTENPGSKQSQLHKSQSQDLPMQPKVLSKTHSYTQDAFSKVSTMQTTKSKSKGERKEQTLTSFSHTHTFSMSSSPIEKEKKTYRLQQTKRPSQETPSPQCPPPIGHGEYQSASSNSEFHRGEKHTSGLRAHHEKQHGLYGSYTGPYTLATEEKTEALLPEEIYSQGAHEKGFPPDKDFHPDHLSEESLSNDEYECTSPDDISLPPLSETPESNMVQSENDLDDGYCVSSHSLHTSHYSQQCHSGHGEPFHYQPGESFSSPTIGQASQFRAESCSYVQSPLTVPTPTLVSNTISSILKSSKPKGLAESQQTVYSVHECRIETQKCVHEPVSARHSSTAWIGNMHAFPIPLTSEQEPELCKPTEIREEIKRSNSARAGGNVVPGQSPKLSKHLSNAMVMEGSPVTLEVEVTGYPEPALTWFKNGQELHSDERMLLSNKEGKHVLFIGKAAQTDSGQYLVHASNSAGMVSSSTILQVKGNDCPDFDTFKLDWQTCFGTLCVLLWLIYLLVLYPIHGS